MPTPESPKTVNSVTLLWPSCAECHSIDLRQEGSGRWDFAAQEWIFDHSDSFYCGNCDAAHYTINLFPIQQTIEILKADLHAPATAGMLNDETVEACVSRLLEEIAELEAALNGSMLLNRSQTHS
jgi:hypothetical protein